MKSHRAILIVLLAVGLAASSCNSRAERSEGTVLLEITSLGAVPVGVSLTQASGQVGGFQLATISLANIIKDPAVAVGSNFQDIELRSYEVTYRRRDTGTRVPPPLTGQISGTVSANSTGTLSNLPFITSNQLLNPPLSDLLSTAARDSETGSAIIVLDVSIRIFGRTISGDDVASQVDTFTIEVTH